MEKIVKAKMVHPSDVKILAPPAEFALLGGSNSKKIEDAAKSAVNNSIDAQSVIEWQKAELRTVESELQKTRMVTANIANAALCLYKLLLDEGYSKDGDKIIFPKELVEKMAGQKISIGDDEHGNRFVRVQSRVPHVTWEGRSDE